MRYYSGDHYSWHTDNIPEIPGTSTAPSQSHLASDGRVLSVTVQLTSGVAGSVAGSDSGSNTGSGSNASYSGGAVSVLGIEMPKSIGSLAVFPSYVPHRVYPGQVRRSEMEVRWNL
jgi:hypothetical protein